jgi:molybdopterin-containing oxidoreductase family iron-sulfur binding subunit
MRGVVEKCNLCHGRMHAAKEKAAAEGRKNIAPEDYVPACVEACPTGAITFGDLADEESPVSRMVADNNVFRFLDRLGTEAKVYYRSQQPWIHQLAEKKLRRSMTEKKEVQHG